MTEPTGAMSAAKFIAKWSQSSLPERAASQEHFIDLCRLLGQPTPADHDKTGAEYTFEKGVAVTGPASKGSKGTRGFADVWWADKFGWEYKTKDKYDTLDQAYQQLLKYREALGNPPLLIVSDIARIEIHTNFTGTAKQTHTIALEDLADGDNLAKLRRVFTDPYGFKPKLTLEQVTRDVANDFGKLAKSIEQRDHDPQIVAHFLMKCMFCLFAEDVGLLPDQLFNRTLSHWHNEPKRLTPVLTDLFAKMRDGGAFGPERIEWFNGGLFDDQPALELNHSEIGVLLMAAGREWSQVDPSIFGTLFERSLDPAKRSQIGAHYTSRDDIMLIIEPVVMKPLRAKWQQVRQAVEAQIERRRKASTAATKRKADDQINQLFDDFLADLASVRILDPACGSGNFLYVAIQQLLALEKQVITYAAQPHIAVGLVPNIRPTQLHGIEINPFAAELAKVVIWIGYLQWMRDNGFAEPRQPILDPLETIECRDAILDFDGQSKLPAAADWPDADFIIGNPPFLGGSLIWEAFGTEYRDAMWKAYEIPNGSDLCCYWFERARMVIQRQTSPPPPGEGKGGGSSLARRDTKSDSSAPSPSPSRREGGRSVRVGLLATQGIRGGANREVLKRIKQTGDIFMAWADREWILDGAAVHVSMVGFDDGSETERLLGNTRVDQVHADLTSTLNLTGARTLGENKDISWRGTQKSGQFNIPIENAHAFLATPNPTPKPNSDVVRPWVNGRALTHRYSGVWIIDFGVDATEQQAALFEEPFEYVKKQIKPQRESNKRDWRRLHWWLHAETCPGYREAVKGLDRFICTPRVAKFRLFKWLDAIFLPDDGTYAFARSDDYFFGVLHSSVHELWARRMGTQLREAESGFRYTPTTCFETFALPWSPGSEPCAPAGEPDRADPADRADTARLAWQRIAEAAKQLNEQRERWLNPPEWIDSIARTVDAMDDFADVEAVSGPEAKRLIRESAIMAMAAKDARLKKRTLTNLYNERPTWLKQAHEQLDRAVLAAYALTDPGGDWGEDWAAVWTDSGAGQPLPTDHPLLNRRAEVDRAVLTNLLRLNEERAGGQ